MYKYKNKHNRQQADDWLQDTIPNSIHLLMNSVVMMKSLGLFRFDKERIYRLVLKIIYDQIQAVNKDDSFYRAQVAVGHMGWLSS